MTEIEERFVHLVRGITELQWVRESLPTHSKNYESLQKKLQKQTELKEFSEKELKAYQAERDQSSLNSRINLFNSNNHNQTTYNNRSYTDLITSVKYYENAIQEIQTQIDQAKEVIDDLRIEKRNLDLLCDQLHSLYEEVIIPDLEDSGYRFEQQLKTAVEKLHAEIPINNENIQVYKLAQSKLYGAYDLITKAMRSLPGASTILDRQALVASHNYNNQNTLFLARSISSAMFDPIRNADKIAQSSYQLVKEASEICKDVPLIPVSTPSRFKSGDVETLLTYYRGYKMKIEETLKKQVNPQLQKYENNYASSKYQYEQRTIEWIDHQISILEDHLRSNGLLVNQDLGNELSRLRMGSRAAMAAVASEVSGRVTVDDALDITRASDQDVLPEYSSSSSSSSSNSSVNSDDGNDAVVSTRCSNVVSLPSYYGTQTNDLPPPAYTR